MTLIRDINNILEYGRKVTSYKFVTLLGIFDYIAEHATEAPINNLHFIPLAYLAKQFVSHYYPICMYDFPQGSLAEDKDVKVKTYIQDFKENIKKDELNHKNTVEIIEKIRVLEENGVFWINRLYELPDPLPNSLIKLLWITRNLILDQPLQFIHNVNGEIIRFFSLINSGTPFNSEYELHRKDGMRAKKPIAKNWIDLLKYDPTNIVIEDLTYQELARYRFWARAVILKAWYDFIVRLLEKMTNNQHLDSNLTIFHNLIEYSYLNKESRDQSLINHYRDFYTQIKGLKGVFSGKDIVPNEIFHLDHLLPWSYHPVNRFWNLYPCEPEINSKKSDNIPEWSESLERNVINHLKICLEHRENSLIENDLKYFYAITQKRDEKGVQKREEAKILKELLEHVKQEWTNLNEIVPGERFKFL